MKILAVSKIRELDSYTIENEPILSIDLMERAAMACCDWIEDKYNADKIIKIICGPGNNGGDGLAIARILSNKGYHLMLDVLSVSDNFSDDFMINLDRLKKIEIVEVRFVNSVDDLSDYCDVDLLVDAIFGSGLSKSIKGLPAMVIERMNAADVECISIDIPSGLFADRNTDSEIVVNATHTLVFQLPKLAFFFPENNQFVGRWHVLPIGLSQDFIDNCKTNHFFCDNDYLRKMLKKRNKFSHKGTYGHAFLIAGSRGKMGACILAAKACLRGGVGLLTVRSSGNDVVLHTAVPEAMLGDVDLSNCSAIAIGPGTGDVDGLELSRLMKDWDKPMIFDADAINTLGRNKKLLDLIPEDSIFTPHPKEFERIAGKSKNNFHRKDLLYEFAVKYKSYVVLKGAHSIIACPDGVLYFNNSGNNGMATAGSGDVLTGLLLSLLAQGYSPKEVCLLGVHVHGLAGDLALNTESEESLIAGDIICSLGKAFNSLK